MVSGWGSGTCLVPCEEMPPGVYRDLFVEACLRLCGRRSMDYNEVDQKNPQVPLGASIPRNQVAGHKHEGRSKLGLLEHEDGSILKALQKAPRGTRELDFYRTICEKDSSEPEILQLRQFLPLFYGEHHFDEYPNVTYLKLENLVGRYRKPCVVDIKMGKKTYDPEAGPAKIAKEMTKFPHVEKFGYQFTGMQTYDPVEQKMKFYDKFYCRGLGEDEVTWKGLGTYFGIKHGLRKDAIRVLLNKLYEIERWFLSQRKFAFYASSLLMIYEGDTTDSDYCSSCQHSDYGSSESELDQPQPTDNIPTAKTDSEDQVPSETVSQAEIDSSSSGIENSSLTPSVSNSSVNTQTTASNGFPETEPQVADVRMIDFTHVFNVVEQDDNYLYGLQNLINSMEDLLKKGL